MGLKDKLSDLAEKVGFGGGEDEPETTVSSDEPQPTSGIDLTNPRAPAGELNDEQTRRLYNEQDDLRRRIEAEAQVNEFDPDSVHDDDDDDDVLPGFEDEAEGIDNPPPNDLTSGPSNNATGNAALGRDEPTRPEIDNPVTTERGEKDERPGEDNGGGA